MPSTICPHLYAHFDTVELEELREDEKELFRREAAENGETGIKDMFDDRLDELI